MFLFQENHIKQIMAETKTHTRRNHKKWRGNLGSVHQVRSTLFGKPHCHIRILSRWEERLGDISFASAIREGGYTPSEYIEGMIEMHKGKVDIATILKVYVFELVKD